MRKKQDWMELSQEEIDSMVDESWDHYQKGGCLCFAHDSSECVCGSFDRKPEKRQPLADGTLELTSDELEEFKQFFQQPQKVGKNDWIKVERVYIAMHGFIFADILSQSSAIRPIQEPSLLPECVKKYTAILYLAKLFDLTEGLK